MDENREIYENYRELDIYLCQSGYGEYYLVEDEEYKYSRTNRDIDTIKKYIDLYIQLKKDIISKEKTMNNKMLYDEVLCLSSGDDYDGYFTPEGAFVFNFLKDKLEHRLKDWLNY